MEFKILHSYIEQYLSAMDVTSREMQSKYGKEKYLFSLLYNLLSKRIEDRFLKIVL